MDVRLFQTPDGGDIAIEGGQLDMTPGLDTAVYLSLFGGNVDGVEWWGNLGETEPGRRYIGETQRILQTLPGIPANLLRLEDAARRDLKWMLDTGAATEIEAVARIPALNSVLLSVTINGDTTLEFSENWKASV